MHRTVTRRRADRHAIGEGPALGPPAHAEAVFAIVVLLGSLHRGPVTIDPTFKNHPLPSGRPA